MADPGLPSDAAALVVFFAASFTTAYVGSRFTFASLESWYKGLRKPTWAPTGRTIGMIWSALYILMAIAGWLVWWEAGIVLVPLALFAIQLVLNATWS